MHSDVLQKQLKPAVRRGLPTSGVFVQRDKATSHSPSYRETDLGFKTGDVTFPPHSPDLASSYFHFFWPLKDAVRDITSNRIRR